MSIYINIKGLRGVNTASPRTCSSLECAHGFVIFKAGIKRVIWGGFSTTRDKNMADDLFAIRFITPRHYYILQTFKQGL